MEIRQRVWIDMDRCIECKSCFAACYYGHHRQPIVNYASIGSVTLPIICRQCDEPTCVEACPYEALYRNDQGIVKRSLALCRGCGSCVPACPFGTIPSEMYRHQVPKCDLCEDWVLQELPPRCVSSCPGGALQFLEITENELEQQGQFAVSGRTLSRHLWKRR